MSALHAYLTLVPLVMCKAAASKWTLIDPYQMERGPDWIEAATDSLSCNALLLLALLLHGWGFVEAAHVAAYIALGAALSSAYVMNAIGPFPHGRGRGRLSRFASRKLDTLMSACYPLVFVFIYGFLLSPFYTLDGVYWTAIGLGILLLVEKTFFIRRRFHGELNPALRLVQAGVLVRGSVALTSVVGIGGLLLWLLLSHSILHQIGAGVDHTHFLPFLIGVVLYGR
ncbi:hypothetical protein [Ancylobacter lacus]|uniref:hypothetical protein n=1 Tax=Ancylobacter lacus TaxID=2579970 RepID=UPI001BCE566A|nr:hypothetical protein [Ancylobacter lacus]MBS7538950.1 hypothetical protein [Ancylobacter lacus]